MGVTRDKKTWRVRWTPRKGEKRKSRNFPEGIAKHVADKFDTEIKLKKISGTLLNDVPTLREFIPRYFELYETIKQRESSTILKVDTDLRCHVLPVLGDRVLDTIMPIDILDLRVALAKEGLGTQTIRNVMGALSTVFKVAVIANKCLFNPCKSVPAMPRKEKGEAKPPKFWTFEQSDDFLRYVHNENWELFQLFAFALNSGLRPGELHALKRDCLNFRESYVHVKRNFDTKLHKINEYTKTKLERKVSLSPIIMDLLSNKVRLSLDENVFANISFSTRLNEKLAKLAKAAKVPKLTMHGLRHTFASQLVMRGRSLLEVGELLGHQKYDSTKIYAHLADDYKKGLTDVLLKDCHWIKILDTKIIPLSRI